MARLTDIVLSAMLSGAITFGTTFYFNERTRVQAAHELAAAREAADAERHAAEEAHMAADRQSKTWQYYQLWQSEGSWADREILTQAAARPGADFKHLDPHQDAALQRALGFYVDLGIALRARQLDPDLSKQLFQPNVRWLAAHALPSLCQGYEGDNDRLNAALRTFDDITDRPLDACRDAPRRMAVSAPD